MITAQSRLPRERSACENGTWKPPARSENPADCYLRLKQANVNLFRKIFTALVVVALLAGCASFTYNRLDWLIPWYVDGYVDLTGDQRALLRERLTPSLE